MKRYIRSTQQTQPQTGIFYKNVDICDLPSILSKGILSMNASGNNNWDSGHRVNNSRDVVYLFRPTGYENSFVQYGVALLEVEVDGVENEMVETDVNRGKYIEYICDCVPPENIRAVYIPKLFKNRISFRHSKIRWVRMEAKIFSSELWESNMNKYGEMCSLGYKKLPDDFDGILNYENCSEELLRFFADTAPIEDSSEYNYFRGITPDSEMIDLEDIHYDI